MGRDDRYALGLARQTEELFIPGGFALPDRGEVLVFVAEEKDLAEMLFRALMDGNDANVATLATTVSAETAPRLVSTPVTLPAATLIPVTSVAGKMSTPSLSAARA